MKTELASRLQEADSTPAEMLDRVTSELDAEWPADRIAEYLTGLAR